MSDPRELTAAELREASRRTGLDFLWSRNTRRTACAIGAVKDLPEDLQAKGAMPEKVCEYIRDKLRDCPYTVLVGGLRWADDAPTYWVAIVKHLPQEDEDEGGEW